MVKSQSEALGGSCGHQHNPGGGSVFYFRIPLVKPDLPLPCPVAQSRLQPAETLDNSDLLLPRPVAQSQFQPAETLDESDLPLPRPAVQLQLKPVETLDRPSGTVLLIDDVIDCLDMQAPS